MRRIVKWLTLARVAGLLSLTLGLAGSLRGPVPYLPIPGLAPFHQSISSELLALGITVLVIDNANERLAIRQEKERLILQLGSPTKEFVIEALRQLRWRGFLEDGSMRNATLAAAKLDHVNMSGANLCGAYMAQAALTRSLLVDANLGGTMLEGADLTLTILIRTNLNRALLCSADLSGAIFQSACMFGADLRLAVLKGVTMWHSDMREANLSGANLMGATLYGTDFSKADLSAANLEGSDILLDGQLSHAGSLWGATMQDGTRYNGCLNLPGDLSMAIREGVDTTAASAMAGFYLVSLKDYEDGQSPSTVTLVDEEKE